MSRAKGAMVASAIVCAAIGWVSRGRLAAQQSQTPPAFEVATVRRNTAVEGRTLMDGSGGRYTVTNAPLRTLLLVAYEIEDPLLIGPRWIDTARYDIVASRGGAPFAEVPAMLRTLLAERFKLTTHVEPREMPMVTLIVAREDRRFAAGLKPAECAAGSARRERRPAEC